ncbi:MAG: P-II family nitrogen regulator [Tissierellaceae bacterium]|nr:P-II family nitrogen regulator [Tissierellaceae bacterium]
MNITKDGLILFFTIIDFGKGSKVLRVCKEMGAIASTIFLGKGTVKNEILNVLGILDVRKEIFITIVGEELEDKLYDTIEKRFHLDKPHHGIAFSIPLNYCIRVFEDEKYISNPEKKGVKEVGHEAIFVIAEKGQSEDILDAAVEAGSTGGTVIHGRGCGTRQREVIFNIEIEPEKDIVLILSKMEKTEAIVDSIKHRLKIEEPGAGIIFVMDVTRTLGLFQGSN